MFLEQPGLKSLSIHVSPGNIPVDSPWPTKYTKVTLKHSNFDPVLKS